MTSNRYRIVSSVVVLLLMLAMNSAVSAQEDGQDLAENTGYRGSYFKNGEIHVGIYGEPEGKPLTSGHQDFKPSWSKTGDMLVFFRRLSV